MKLSPMLVTLVLLTALTAPADRLAQAQAAYAAGERADAVAILEAMLESREGPERQVRLLLAEVLCSDGQSKSALSALNELGEEGEDVELLLANGRAFWAWGGELSDHRKMEDAWYAYGEARFRFEKAAELAPEDDTRAAVETMALVLYTFGEHEPVIERANGILERHPDDAEVLLLRAMARSYAYFAVVAEDSRAGKEEWKQAVEELTLADTSLAPDRVDALNQLAWLHAQDGQTDKAVDLAIAALDRHPEAPFDMLFALADRFGSEDKLTAAQRALVTMVEIDAEEVTALIQYSADPPTTAAHLQWAALEAKPASRSFELLSPIMAADPESAAIWNNYGLHLRDAGRYEESYEAYERAVELDDTDPRILNDTALILHYYLDRDTERAVELYKRAGKLAEASLATADELEPERRAYLRKAQRDARNNLAKLERGNRIPK